MRKLRTSVLALCAVAGLGLSVPAAAEASAVTVAKPAGNAPGCVHVWQKVGRITKTGYAKNNCTYTVRIKIVWARGGDGECRTVRPGGTITSKVPRGVRTFDGAGKC
ncbi:hypothetical protein [Planomonospora sp. ID82291]|uniref:hypothetical protein n=1 Tax=Planomonospora sp. ID82291 TaxID=2738136 RepID=UPI0018C43CA0|nr:hypothetical protein [Planomonospora sp. ID82291]MBG0816521.1 hypothetical protein [Planomonospora sp. ID82291]